MNVRYMIMVTGLGFVTITIIINNKTVKNK